MTKSAQVMLHALTMAEADVPQREIARQLGVSRRAVSSWLRGDRERTTAALLVRRLKEDACARGCCVLQRSVPRSEYAYLLGLYLGDGWIATQPNGVYRLRITCCNSYPSLRTACERTLASVMPTSRVGVIAREGCDDVCSYSKHWPCLLPQHGRGRKHERRIELAPWQQAIVEEHPREFVKGLIHSDGTRCMNRVTVRGKRYEYSRYFFTNASHDIRMLFGDACDRIGVEWRHNNKRSISVARRASVAILEEFIGPKT